MSGGPRRQGTWSIPPTTGTTVHPPCSGPFPGLAGTRSPTGHVEEDSLPSAVTQRPVAPPHVRFPLAALTCTSVRSMLSHRTHYARPCVTWCAHPLLGSHLQHSLARLSGACSPTRRDTPDNVESCVPTLWGSHLQHSRARLSGACSPTGHDARVTTPFGFPLAALTCTSVTSMLSHRPGVHETMCNVGQGRTINSSQDAMACCLESRPSKLAAALRRAADFFIDPWERTQH